MSNRVSVQYTKFVNLDVAGNELDFNYGYRIYDDYESVYNNTYSTFKELEITVHEENVWAFLLHEHPNFYEAAEHNGRVEINDVWIEFKGIDPQEGEE